MKGLWLFLLLFFQLSSSAQEKYNKIITGNLLLKRFSKDDELKQWFLKERDNYHPNEAVLQKLKRSLIEKKIVVVLGTWCSDSQREFPHLIKVLSVIQFPLKNLKIYGVNRSKSLPARIIAKYKITNVPTIILLDKDGTEKGRIIEEVKKSVEADLLGF